LICASRNQEFIISNESGGIYLSPKRQAKQITVPRLNLHVLEKKIKLSSEREGEKQASKASLSQVVEGSKVNIFLLPI
jgi:hypothetical protein